MGIKKGRELFSQKSAVSTSLKKLREKIIKEKGVDMNYRPSVAIDGEVWARQSLSNPHKDSKVSSEYHSEPKVPVKRTRCLKHLKSGSFELMDIKVSSNLRSELMPDAEFFVIDFTCAPSQKGLGTEGKVYSLRLALRKENDSWKLMESPYSLCGCPVGVFKICAHKGGALLLIYAIRNCFKELCYADLCKRLPPSIHSVARQLQVIHHAYPAPYTDSYRIEMEIKKEAKVISESESSTNDDEEELNDIELEEQNDREMESEEKSVPLIDVCDTVSKWCCEIEVALATRGFAHQHNIEESIAASVKAAKPEKDVKFLLRQHLRFSNQEHSVKERLAPKTVYGYYCREYVSNMSADDNAEYIANKKLLRAQTKSVYRGVYSDAAEYLDEYANDSSDSDDRLVCYVNLDGEDSNDDSDYYI